MKFEVSGTDDHGDRVSVTWEDGALSGEPEGIGAAVEAGAGERVPEPVPGLVFDPADAFSTLQYLRLIFFPELVAAKDVAVSGEVPEAPELPEAAIA